MRSVLCKLAAFALATLVAIDGAAAEELADLLNDAKPVLDMRYRFEFVDQDGKPDDATANTVRTRLGIETGRFRGLWAGVDAEWIEAIGGTDFNDTINGKTRYPVVADPNDLQLNQLFIASENTIPGTGFKIGRQRIIWDNARFIGNVGFRQNEQTFDALSISTSLLPDTDIGYTYLDEVHRIFGTDSAVGELGLEGHAIRAQFRGLDFATLTPFVLLLDYDKTAQDANSSATAGLTIDGKWALDEQWTLLYHAGAAHQSDYGGNPGDFDLWYYAAEPGIRVKGAEFRLGYEVLQGDGTSAFQTPLATLHAFNGVTDQFLVTPPDGLRDLYGKLKFKTPPDMVLPGVVFKAAYHQFWADEGSADYGSEWDVGLSKTFATDHGNFVLGIQYADYDADKFSVDTQKLWLTLQFKISPKPFRDYASD